jgi:hypothetical protein
MQLPFTFHVHSTYSSGEKADIIGDELQAAAKLRNFPFEKLPEREELREALRFVLDEVELSCLYDTETGQVTLASAKL